MDAEFLRLAQEAVTALQLQAAGSTRWVEIAQLVVHGVAVVVIHIGLWQMKVAGKRRDREIDEMAEAFRKQGEAADRMLERQRQAFERQAEVLAPLLRRPSEAER